MSGRTVARLVPALVVALVLSLLAGPPAQAYDPAAADEERRAEIQDVEALDSTGNENTVPGNSSALGEALAAAKESGERVEVESLRTEYDTFYANPDGTYSRETTQTPTRMPNAEDKLVAIDPTLAKSDGRLEPKVAPEDVSFSATGDDALADLVVADGVSISLALPDLDLAAPKVEGGVATYDVAAVAPAEAPAKQAPSDEATPETAPSEAAPSAPQPEPVVVSPADAVRVGVGANGFAAHLVLDKAPTEAPTYSFDFRTPGLSAKLDAGAVFFYDAAGTLVAQSSPLRMWDSQVDTAGIPTNVADVDAELVQIEGGWRVLLRPSLEFLTAKGTAYPVVIDPDISSVTPMGDTYFSDGTSANTSFASSYFLNVGYTAPRKNRAFVSFAYNQYSGATVTAANLKLWQMTAASCTAAPTNVYSISGGDGAARTWNTQPSYTNDVRWTSQLTAQKGASGCAAGAQNIDVTSIVNGWAGNHVGPNAKPFASRDVYNNRMGFMLLAGNETDSAQRKQFCSDNWNPIYAACPSADRQPTLSVTFTPETGAQPWYSMTSRPLGDRMNLQVNNRNGNVVVQNTDIDVAGIGIDFSLQRTYNSQGVENGPLGPRWSLSMGPDVWLEKKSEFRFDFHGPGGTVIGSFVRKSSDPASPDYTKFSTPIGGAGADLSQSGAEFTLTFRDSQSKYVFGQPDANGHTYMRYMRDRSNNQIEVQYSGTAGSKPKVSQFIDTAGRTYTPTYSGNVITQIDAQNLPGIGQRGWVYAYTSGNLTSSNDAIGNPTSYEYTTVGGAPRLSKITQPVNQSGSAPTTEITYNSPSLEVATVGYRLNNSGTGLLTYSYQFASTVAAACQGNGNLSTIITDPRGKPTTYCYAERNNTASNAKTWVYDALGKPRTEDYSADNQPLTMTSAGNQSLTADGSTVAAYNNDITDQLTSVTQPKNSSSSGQAGTSFMSYDPASTAQGGTYLPISIKDTAGDCNTYGYDSMGRTTSTFSGVSSNAAGVCGSTTGLPESRTEYNPNGTVSKTWDANANVNGPTTLTDAEKTVYTYWQTTDPGFVAGTQWQVKSIKKPGGDCSTTSARRLCTSFTYDPAGRVLTETDGRGEVTAYAYDLQDRTTRVFYNGATEFNCLLLALAGDCILYGYDAAGNLMDRRSQEGFSVIYYDRLNRQVKIDTPSGGGGVDVVAMAFDGANNLISYQQTVSGQPVDITNYGYDDANRPNVVINAFGVTGITSDDDGRPTAIVFPEQAGYPGTRINYSYTSAGQPQQMKWMTRDNATELVKWDYKYTKTFPGTSIVVDTPQMQSRQVSSAYTGIATPGTTSYGYTQQRLTTATDTAGPDYTYNYDKVGNILSEKVDATTTHFGYDKAGQLCWQGGTAGTAAQKLSLTCAAGPSGSTAYSSDAAGNNVGTSAGPITYNDDSQVTDIGGKSQNYLDQGNDLRVKSGSERQINGPLGITATVAGGQTVHISRLPDGTPLTSRPTTGTQSYFITEPNGNVSFLVDPFGYHVGGYTYAPYGKTTVGGGVSGFNSLRWMGEYQETDASGAAGHYKLGARYYDTNGHFTQPDAVTGNMGDPRTMTAYNYSGSDPINFGDPSGYAKDPLCNTKGSTGYYVPNCGGQYYGGGPGGGPSLKCQAIGVGEFFVVGTATLGPFTSIRAAFAAASTAGLAKAGTGKLPSLFPGFAKSCRERERK